MNDTFGHPVGDDVLQAIALILKENVRTTDIVGRWGGEEFMIISPHTNKIGAYNLAITINTKVQEHLFETVGYITISAGVSEIKESLDIDTLIDDADTRLYLAKIQGRNRVLQNTKKE